MRKPVGERRAPSRARRGRRRANGTGTRAVIATDGGSHPSLESALYGLATAEDAAAYARRHGLDLTDGTVGVEVLLAEGASVPEDRLATVGPRFENRLEATVPVEQLLPLAESRSVRYVDRRDTPHRHTDT